MKYCPICERSYRDEVEVCEADGATLRVAGSKQDPFIGQTIKGRYRVMRKLGEGGMGTVYLAEQVSIGRRVALKVLHGQYARDEEFVKRFRHEARLAAALNHRNVITVYDFDQADEGSLFIAMEYVDGKSLSEVVRQEGPLDVGRAVRLGTQIAEGLGAAHRAGVIHRDIKPENIMVVGEEENIKLMDFGIARLRDAGTMTRLTRAGVIMGTPAYMSPEQIEGGEISEKTDIYAFGIVLYEMLSGGVPFKASTPGAVLVKHLQEAPIGLRKLRREIPSLVERVVMTALEKKAQKRQRSMDEVVQGLKKAGGTLAGEEIPKTLVESLPLGGKITDKLLGARRPLVVAGVLLLPVIVGLWFILWVGGWIGTKPEKPVTVKVVSLAIQAEKRDLKAKERIILRLKGKYPDGSEGEITQGVEWRSSNTSVATVSPKGQVEALAGGNVDITARYVEMQTSPLTLFVKGGEVEPPVGPSPLAAQVVSLTVDADRRELRVKDRVALRVRGRYSDGSEGLITKGVDWQTSDRAVVTINSKGQAEGRREGNADVTARYGDIASSPLTLVVRATKIPEPTPPPIDKGKIADHIKIARFYRERGEYADAFSELQKASGLDPNNRDVRAEVENTRKACLAEKKLGRAGLPC